MKIRKMRILHAPYNIAAQSSVLSRAQRKLGAKSDVLVWNQNMFNYECDFNLNLNKKREITKIFLKILTFFRVVFKYNIFHFSYGESLWPYNLDLPIYRLLGKKIVMGYYGSDVIQTDIVQRYTLWTDQDIKNIYPRANDNAKRAKLQKISSLVDQTTISDYSLLPYSPKSKVTRIAINIEGFPYVGAKAHHGKIKIIHAPSNRDVKGTKFILAAVERLKKEKYPIEFILVENKPNTEAIKIYRGADIVIDEVKQGPYGVLALECMALGKPVLCYRNRHFAHYYKNLPVVSTNPENIYQKLVELIKNPKRREILGRKGRQYVEENHDSIIIAEKLIRLYGRL